MSPMSYDRPSSPGFTGQSRSEPFDAAYWRKRSAHFRELAVMMNDEQALKALLELADEYEAQADAMDAARRQ